MWNVVICLGVLVFLAGCGGSHHRDPQPKSSQQQQQQGGGGGWAPSATQLVAEVPYPQTAADCTRQLEAQARAAGVRVTVRETRPKDRGFTCVGDVRR
jgi:hypothetical protein